jgi:hypothetical protein
MGTKGETIRVRISPRSRAWQPVILAMALVASLVLAFAIDRMAGSSPGTGTELPITWPIQQYGPQAHIAGMHHGHPHHGHQEPNQQDRELGPWIAGRLQRDAFGEPGEVGLSRAEGTSRDRRGG